MAKTFTLELCVLDSGDLTFAQMEAGKLFTEVKRIAPTLYLDILPRVADHPVATEMRWDGGTATVLLEQPQVADHQCLLITEQRVFDNGGRAILGLAGPTLGWLSLTA